MALLFVNGINDRSVIGVKLDANNNPVQLIDGNCSIHRRLPLKKGIDFEYMLFGKGVKQHGVTFNVEPSLIVNQIADADTHRGALERCIELCRQVSCPVINRPEQVLGTTRDQVSEKLQGIPGVIMPQTLRFQPRSPEEALEYAKQKEIAFPWFIRVCGGHHGKNMVRLDSADEKPALHALPFDGRDFYLTQIVDYRGEDGFYHKHRIIVIDGKPLLRHALYSDRWMVHSDARAFMKERESWQDDITRFDQLSNEVLPTFRPAIDEISKRIKLEYYGIDCCMQADGQLLVFEANANMNVLHSPNEATRYRVEAIRQALYGMLTSYSGEQVI